MLRQPSERQRARGSTWHKGEVALQRQPGVDERNGRNRPQGHSRFHARAAPRTSSASFPFVVIGTVDAKETRGQHCARAFQAS